MYIYPLSGILSRWCTSSRKIVFSENNRKIGKQIREIMLGDIVRSIKVPRQETQTRKMTLSFFPSCRLPLRKRVLRNQQECRVMENCFRLRTNTFKSSPRLFIYAGAE